MPMKSLNEIKFLNFFMLKRVIEGNKCNILREERTRSYKNYELFKRFPELIKTRGHWL